MPSDASLLGFAGAPRALVYASIATTSGAWSRVLGVGPQQPQRFVAAPLYEDAGQAEELQTVNG